MGILRATLDANDKSLLSFVAIDFVAPEQDCDDTPAQTNVISLTEDLSLVDGASSVLLPTLPGDYRVCATALASKEPRVPTSGCSVVEQLVSIDAQLATSIAIEFECGGGQGAIDVAANFVGPPTIIAFDNPSTTVCESARLFVEATDPDTTGLAYDWEITASPLGSNPRLTIQSGGVALFETDQPSSDLQGYTVLVTVSDGSQSARLSFPVRVSSCASAD